MKLDNLPIIAFGERAGLPQSSTDVVMDQYTGLKRVLVKLKRNGLPVISITLHSSIQPVVQVASCPLIQEMVAKNQATYYLYGLHVRHGQFVVDGVRVMWVERDDAKEEQPCAA